MQLQSDQEQTYSAIIRTAVEMECTVLDAQWFRLLFLARQYFTEWYITHGTELRKCCLYVCIRVVVYVCSNIV